MRSQLVAVIFVFELLQNLWQFAKDNAETATYIVTLMTAAAGGVTWFGRRALKRFARRRKRSPEPIDTFPFTVIPVNSTDVEQRIYASKQQTRDNPLAAFNIPYRQRLNGQDTQQVLMERIEAKRWLLILGQTGLGKTREAAVLAQTHSQQGWTVLRLKTHELLTVPDSYPTDRLDRRPKLLFVLDDLNQAIVSGRASDVVGHEVKSMLLESPLQVRLLEILKFYMEKCGPEQVRVLATARNEKERVDEDIPSYWEQLEFEKYKDFWQRFDCYELPQPENHAIEGMLAAAAGAAGVEIKGDLAEIARTNDQTFGNPVANLERLMNKGDRLSIDTFQPTLRGSWQGRYQTAREQYGRITDYLYDGVDLLRQLNVSPTETRVLLVARIVSGQRDWLGLWHRWHLSRTLKALDTTEQILEPRDGQIEAKGYSADLDRYFEQIYQRLSAEVEQKDTINTLMSVLVVAYQKEKYSAALNLAENMLTFSPSSDTTYLLFYSKGLALSALGRKEEAIRAYDQALAIKPDYHQALSDKGLAFSALGRKEEAIRAYDQALAIKPDYHQALSDKGIALSTLGREKEAIIAYDQALSIKPDYLEALNNKGVTLSDLGREKEAIAAYNRALSIKPDYPEALNNKGVTLSALGRTEEALACCNQAIAIKPDDDSAWYNKACFHALLSQADLSIQCLQKTIALEGGTEYIDMAKTDTDFDAIRDHADFQRVLDGKAIQP